MDSHLKDTGFNRDKLSTDLSVTCVGVIVLSKYISKPWQYKIPIYFLADILQPYIIFPSVVMGKHLMLHGDGVKDVAFEVEDCIALYKVTTLL